MTKIPIFTNNICLIPKAYLNSWTAEVSRRKTTTCDEEHDGMQVSAGQREITGRHVSVPEGRNDPTTSLTSDT